MKNLKEGLEEYRLELIFYEEEIEMFRDVIKEANTHHVLIWDEEEEQYGGRKAVIFRIHCGTTSFAMAYYHLGAAVSRKIIRKRKKDGK